MSQRAGSSEAQSSLAQISQGAGIVIPLPLSGGADEMIE
jgi:hypothetical protein